MMTTKIVVQYRNSHRIGSHSASFNLVLDWNNFINIKNSAKKQQQNSTIHNDTE